MNTCVCFVLLLAIGLSAQSEFQADFNKMVETVKLKDGKTLLDCPENCDEVKETACECVHFDHCMTSSVLQCIATGLQRLNLTFSGVLHHRVWLILQKLPNEDKKQWHTPVSPKRFLKYIEELNQKLHALG